MKQPSQQKKVAQPMKSIQIIQQKRQQRRVKMQQAKKERKQKEAYNLASGKNVDIDFQIMIEKNQFKQKMLAPHTSSADLKLAVCVRKRPIFKKQQANGQIDSISCANPQIKIHQPKYRVDGITKYVQNHKFTFDNTFNQEERTEELYQCALKPLVPFLINQGIVTCFAYGQTGSGKTFTMNEIQQSIVKQMFKFTKNCTVYVSFFEIYGGRCLDLLNNKEALNILQDQNNLIQIPGLTQKASTSANELLKIMQEANSSRTTHATVANDTSSRSHAICQVFIKNKDDKQIGKLVLVDLAGSQRAGDTQSNNRQRRMQGAQINKSLLALKQCIRAMDQKADHVPFRASKLTLILRDSFLAKQGGNKNKNKIVMIACISPGSSSADHSLNTLRYADRLKDNSQISKKFQKYDVKQEFGQDKHKENMREQVQQRIASQKNIGVVPNSPRNGNTKTPGKQEKSVSKNANNNGGNQKIPPNLPKIMSNNSNIQNGGQVLNQNRDVPIPTPKSVKKIEKEDKPKQIALKQKNSGSSVQLPKPKKTQRPFQKSKQKQQRVKIQQYKGTSNQFSYQKNVSRNSQGQNYIQQQIQGQPIRQKKIKKNLSNEFQYDDQQQQFIQQKLDKNLIKKSKKVKDDYNAMKQTLTNNQDLNNNLNNQKMLAFTAKVTNIFQQQQQIFATHMATIKQDAKLLTQQSELISMIQGVGFMDYDIDSYVDKLSQIMKKKMRMYALLTKKVDKFRNCLKQQQQMRKQL